jgi:hypothetical protein
LAEQRRMASWNCEGVRNELRMRFWFCWRSKGEEVLNDLDFEVLGAGSFFCICATCR